MKWNADLDTFVLHASVNSVLCGAIGGLFDGRRGGLAGMAAGLAVTALPSASRVAAGWLGILARGFFAVVGISAALAMLAIARAAARLSTGLAPVAHALAPATAAVDRLIRALWMATVHAASGAGRSLATPLGLANAAASGVIVLDFTGIEFAAVLTLAGFAILSLTLIVDESEHRPSMRR